MGRIRDIEKLTNKCLVLTLLKSEISALERNYMKHFNDNNNNNNNNNNYNNNNNNNNIDDTYDDEIRRKISDINMILSGLGNTKTNKDGKKILKSFMK